MKNDKILLYAVAVDGHMDLETYYHKNIKYVDVIQAFSKDLLMIIKIWIFGDGLRRWMRGGFSSHLENLPLLHPHFAIMTPKFSDLLHN